MGFTSMGVVRSSTTVPRASSWGRHSASPSYSPDTGLEAFVCEHVCLDCGWLADTGAEACPACSGRDWVDARHVVLAAALREQEQHRGAALGRGLSRVHTLGLLLVFLSVVVAGISASFRVYPVTGLAASLLLAAGLSAGLSRPFTRLLWRVFGRGSDKPLRRRLPLPPSSSDSTPSYVARRGLAHPSGERMRSPISATSCVAWRVRATVHTDVGRQLVIDDTRSASFELGGQLVAPHAVSLDSEVDGVELTALDTAGQARARRFLRERGCFSHEGRWVLEEQLIGVDAPALLEQIEPGQAPVLRARSS